MKRIILELYQLSELEGQSQKVAIQTVKERFYTYTWERQNQESLDAFVQEITQKGYPLFQFLPPAFLYDKIHKAEKGVYDNYFSGYRLEHFKRDYMPTGYHMDCVLWETFYDGLESYWGAYKDNGIPAEHVKGYFENALAAFIKACKEDEAACEADSEIIMYADSNDHWFFKDGSYFQKGDQYDYVNRLENLAAAVADQELTDLHAASEKAYELLRNALQK